MRISIILTNTHTMWRAYGDSSSNLCTETKNKTKTPRYCLAILFNLFYALCFAHFCYCALCCTQFCFHNLRFVFVPCVWLFFFFLRLLGLILYCRVSYLLTLLLSCFMLGLVLLLCIYCFAHFLLRFANSITFSSSSWNLYEIINYSRTTWHGINSVPKLCTKTFIKNKFTIHTASIYTNKNQLKFDE